MGHHLHIILPAALIAILLVLSQFDSAGLISDDAIMSNWGIEAANSGRSCWQFGCDMVRKFWTEQGRLGPGSALLNMTWIAAVGDNLFVYRVIHQLGNLASLLSVMWLVAEVAGSLRAGVVAAILMASMLCVTTFWHDALLSFGLLMPLVLSFGCWGLVLHLRYLRSVDKLWMRDAALLCTAVSILTYEFGLVFILCHIVIELTQPWRSVSLRRAVPYVLLGTAFVLINLAAKRPGQYEGASVGKLDLAVVLRIYFYQAVGTLPFVSPTSPPAAAIWASTGRPSLSLMAATGTSVGLALFLSIRAHKLSRRQRFQLLALGLCLSAFPPVFTAISQKYQQQLVYGHFYLQGYLQFAGQALVAAALVLSINNVKRRLAKTVLAAGASVAFAFLASFLCAWNGSAVDSFNQFWRYPRDNLGVALADYGRSLSGPVSILVDRETQALASWENPNFLRARTNLAGSFIPLAKAGPFTDAEPNTGSRLFLIYPVPARGDSWVMLGKCASLNVDATGKRIVRFVPGSVRLYNQMPRQFAASTFARLGRYLGDPNITPDVETSAQAGGYIVLNTSTIEIKP